MRQRRLTLVNDPVANAPQLLVDGQHLPIPRNVWFVCTANHDESTAELNSTAPLALVTSTPRSAETPLKSIRPVAVTVGPWG